MNVTLRLGVLLSAAALSACGALVGADFQDWHEGAPPAKTDDRETPDASADDASPAEQTCSPESCEGDLCLHLEELGLACCCE